MKIAHFSDLHYCPKHMEEVDRCFAHAVSAAQDCDIAVISGDLFDHGIDLHSPAVYTLMQRIQELQMPVLILQGTASHDVPGCLDVFKGLPGVFVADRICQVKLQFGGGYVTHWEQSKGTRFETPKRKPAGLDPAKEFSAFFSCLPSINRGAIAAAVGAENVAEQAGDIVADLLAGWADINQHYRALGIPTVTVSHGTVNGSITEHGVPMAGMDHEFTVGALALCGAASVMLGHIHKHQEWLHNQTLIAYPGSIGRLHFGEEDPKGWLEWDFGVDGHCMYDFHETPAKKLIHFDFAGPPDMEELAKAIQDSIGAHVRVRWNIDEEFSKSVDRDAIEAIFKDAAHVKLEARINPVVRSRCAGITQAETLEEKLTQWCVVVEVKPEPLVSRLRELQT